MQNSKADKITSLFKGCMASINSYKLRGGQSQITNLLLTVRLLRKNMKMLGVSNLVMILNLLLMMATAHSLPPRKQQMLGEKQTVIRREASSLDLSSNMNENMVSKLAHLKTELANLSIPSYLKELYINLTYPDGVLSSLSNDEVIKVNTVQSYKSKAKSKLTISEGYLTYTYVP